MTAPMPVDPDTAVLDAVLRMQDAVPDSDMATITLGLFAARVGDRAGIPYRLAALQTLTRLSRADQCRTEDIATVWDALMPVTTPADRAWLWQRMGGVQ